jgi:hypothetical protein
MMPAEFEDALSECLAELRDRLVRDAQARAAGEPIRGGARQQWGEMVRTLAQLVPQQHLPPLTLGDLRAAAVRRRAAHSGAILRRCPSQAAPMVISQSRY